MMIPDKRGGATFIVTPGELKHEPAMGPVLPSTMCHHTIISGYLKTGVNN